MAVRELAVVGSRVAGSASWRRCSRSEGGFAARAVTAIGQGQGQGDGRHGSESCGRSRRPSKDSEGVRGAYGVLRSPNSGSTSGRQESRRPELARPPGPACRTSSVDARSTGADEADASASDAPGQMSGAHSRQSRGRGISQVSPPVLHGIVLLGQPLPLDSRRRKTRTASTLASRGDAKLAGLAKTTSARRHTGCSGGSQYIGKRSPSPASTSRCHMSAKIRRLGSSR